MHGLVNRSIQCFVRDTYGSRIWAEVTNALGVGPEGFESMLIYPDDLTIQLLDETSRVLDKPKDILLEDVGTYLVSHPNSEAIRRLLRFGGDNFPDFLHSLDDLPDRAALAVVDLEFPELELLDGVDGQFTLHVRGPHPEFAYALVGLLRTMADDYGALVLLDQDATEDGNMQIRISLLDIAFAEGRSFSLAGPSQNVAGDPQ